MSQAEQRRIALGAVRSQMRSTGTDPRTAPFDQAWETLDAIYRSDPTLVAAQWYIGSSESQVRTFKREWIQSQSSARP